MEKDFNKEEQEDKKVGLSEEEKYKKQNKKKNIMIAILFLFLLLAFGSKFVSNKTDTTNPTTSTQNKLQLGGNSSVQDGELDLSNSKEVEMKLQADVDASYVNYKINVNPVFNDGKAKGNLMIQNSPENKGVLQVDIIDENNELLYQSPALYPNQSIKDDVLLKELGKGDYEAIAYFRTFDEETLLQTGESGFKIKLTIMN